MKLVTIASPPGGRAGLLLGDEVLDIGMAGELVPLARWAPASLAEVIAGGDEAIGLLQRLADRCGSASDRVKNDLREKGALRDRATTRLLAPIPRPGILLSHGRSYHSHVQEMKPGQKAPDEPVGFMKTVNAVIGPDAPIVLPSSAADQVDFEAEISVVFARPCHGVSAAEAMDYVLGFTIVNDVSARNWVPQLAAKPDLNRMGKQFATFAPMGPCIATLDEIPDMNDIRVVTRLNGTVMQDASTRDLIWSIPELIAYYARWYPFQPGDVLTTGTPEGTGYGRTPRIFMQPGDTVGITVDGVGELSNPIAAPRDPATDPSTQNVHLRAGSKVF